MSSSDELDVSVDVISAGPTPGQQLRLAREKRGLSLDDVTTETNLSPKYLKALEEDDYASLPGLAFARGYARRYAQLVDLDGSALIAEMDVLAAAKGVSVTASLNATGASTQRSHAAMSSMDARNAGDAPSGLTRALAGLQQINLTQVLSVGSLALLALLLLGTLFWQGGSEVSTEPMADNAVIDIDAEVAQQAPVEPPVAVVPVEPVPAAAPELVPVEQDPALAAAMPAADGSTLPATTTPAPASTLMPAQAPAAAVAPVPVQAGRPVSAPAAAPVATAVVTPAASVKPVPSVKPGAVPPPAPAVAPVAAAPVVQPVAKPVPTAPAAPGIDSLNFSFSGKSWISVRDATGQELVYGLKNAGQAVTVTGQAPFSINIGNVNVTTLSRNGRGVNLKQYARGEIASFRLAPSAPPKP